MQKMTKRWDYLIVTAANEEQAREYDVQICRRQKAGEIAQAKHCLVVADTQGKRIGSGGSTLQCLLEILKRERPDAGPGSFAEAEAILSGLRILIIHAGGDSRRLPAYSHCGKIFVPVPAKADPSIASTLFDRLTPAFFALPEAHCGQVVVASGDALILFDSSTLNFSRPGITALASLATTSDAAHHGVFCAEAEGSVRRFLQKPSLDSQIAAGAVDSAGNVILDLGVMSCDAAAVTQWLRTFCNEASQNNGKSALAWKDETHEVVLSAGIDLYREICCALGTATTLDQYLQSARVAGSAVNEALLTEWFSGLRLIPLSVEVLRSCRFLHFGTTRQLIASGNALQREDATESPSGTLILNSEIRRSNPSTLQFDHAWVEGCYVEESLTLEGFNAIVGVDVSKPLRLRRGACLDMSEGIGRRGEKTWFLRYYDIDDTFKHAAEAGGTFCGRPLRSWLVAMGATHSDLWAPDVAASERILWNARVFPAMPEPQEFLGWLWLFEIESATDDQKVAFLNADRYSSAEIAVRVDQHEFHARRSRIRSAATLSNRREPAPAPA